MSTVTVASMDPVAVNPSAEARFPSWKAHTITPNEAPMDSTFISSALTGSTSDPNAANSSTIVTDPTTSAIHGSRASRLSWRSSCAAVAPPTTTRRVFGSGDKALIVRTRALASSDMGSRSCRTASRTAPFACDIPATSTAVTCGSRFNRAARGRASTGLTGVTALIGVCPCPSGPGRAGSPVKVRSTRTCTSIGAIAFLAKSRSRVSATRRPSEPAGSTRWSTFPNLTCRNGSASATSTTLTATR